MVDTHEGLYAYDRNKTKLRKCFFKDICIKLRFLKQFQMPAPDANKQFIHVYK